MNILIIGSGGREHAFSWKIKQSPLCDQLYVLPGNAGTAELGKNVNIGINDFESIGEYALSNDIELIVVGPEEPLVKGITDFFRNSEKYSKIKIVGPGKEGAKLEGSKDYAKAFMERHKIPTGKYETFTRQNIDEGLAYIEKIVPPIVLKADGLAAGKGVIIAQSQQEAKDELNAMLIDEKFGSASAKVVIEEFLDGMELSVFVLTDGENYLMLPEAKDYKRIGENDSGPNTGGMGAVTPVVFADRSFMQKVEDRIIKPTVNGLKNDKIDYVGFIFIGLMNVKGDPFVIEYNVRMGDPETQAVLARVNNDLVSLLDKAAQQKLGEETIEIADKVATTIVMVSGGYPGKYEKGHVISGIEDVDRSIVFHAGTTFNSSQDIVTNGGRVLALTALADSVNEALEIAYDDIKKINWTDVNFRNDIGQDILKLLD